jgi:hypothetical protein
MSKNYANENENMEREHRKGKDNLTEGASGTCFSSEQEVKYRTKEKSRFATQVNKITNAISKSFIPPNSGTHEEPGTNKFSDLTQRTKWTFFMLFGFLGFISLGNFYCAFLVLIVIMLIYAELLDLSRYKDRNTEVKNYYLISWYI